MPSSSIDSTPDLNGKGPIDKSRLKRFYQRYIDQAEDLLSPQRAPSKGRGSRFLKQRLPSVQRFLRTEGSKIHRLISELPDGEPLTTDQISNVCRAVDEGYQALKDRYTSEPRLTERIETIIPIIDQARRDFRENFELATPSKEETPTLEVEVSANDDSEPANDTESQETQEPQETQVPEKTLTAREEFEARGIYKREAVDIICRMVTGSAAEFTKYFLAALANDESLDYANKLAHSEVHAIGATYEKFFAQVRTMADRELGRKPNFQEFWENFTTSVAGYQGADTPISKHFKRQVIDVTNDMLNMVNNAEDLIGFHDQEMGQPPTTEQILAVLAPDKKLAANTKDDYPISEDEQDAIEDRLELGDEAASMDDYVKIARQINNLFHGGLALRTGVDIQVIDGELREVEEDDDEGEIIETIEIAEAGSEMEEAPEAETSSAELSIPPEVTADIATLDDEPTSTTGILQVMQHHIGQLRENLQEQADLHKICETLIMLQANLVAEAKRYYEMRNPTQEQIDEFNAGCQALSSQVDELGSKIRDLIAELQSYRSAVHSASNEINAEKTDKLQENLDILQQFLDRFGELDEAYNELDSLSQALEQLKLKVVELQDGIRKGNEFVNKVLPKRLGKVKPQDLFMTPDHYLLEENTSGEESIHETLENIRDVEAWIGDLLEEREKAPENYADAARESIAYSTHGPEEDVAKPKPSSKSKPKVTKSEQRARNLARAVEKDMPSDAELLDCSIASPDDRSLRADSLGPIKLMSSELHVDTGATIDTYEIVYQGETIRFTNAGLRALQVLDYQAKFKPVYRTMGRESIVLALLLTESCAEFSHFKGEDRPRILAEMIEKDFEGLAEKVDQVGRISLDQREAVRSPAISFKRPGKGQNMPIFTSSTVNFAFLQAIGPEIENGALTTEEKREVTRGILTRLHRNRLKKQARIEREKRKKKAKK